MSDAERFPRTLPEFNAAFATEQACREYLFRTRWPAGWRCPRCGHETGWLNRRQQIVCAACDHQQSLTAGTVFHGTKKPLALWFQAMFLMVTQKNGVSAKTLERLLGLSYPTAWTWLHKLRRALARRPQAPLTGCVEVDETYIGGYQAHRPGRRRPGEGKELVLVAVETQDKAMGRVRLTRVADHRRPTLTAAVSTSVAPGATVRTDGLSSYDPLAPHGYDHQRHVVGDDERRAVTLLPQVHKVISLLKRWLLGTHQGAAAGKHLPFYLEEFEFRFNRRTSRHRTLLFERLVGFGLSGRAQPYWRIIGRSAPDQPLLLAAT